eukprot:3141901-Prymnesium_polylepis.1
MYEAKTIMRKIPPAQDMAHERFVAREREAHMHTRAAPISPLELPRLPDPHQSWADMSHAQQHSVPVLSKGGGAPHAEVMHKIRGLIQQFGRARQGHDPHARVIVCQPRARPR